MAKMYYDDAADLALIRAKNVAVIGYGSQGHAHALNLRDSGVSVKVGLPATSRSRAKATEAGLIVGDVAEVSKWADVIMILIPDTSAAKVYSDEIAPNLAPGKMVMFAHGFNIRFGTITVRSDVDVAMVAPKSPGHRVRELFVEGAGTPALFAIHQDATGRARALTLSYAKGIGVTRASGAEFLPLSRTLVNIGQTFPPVAVLAVAVPLVGFGEKPTLIALFAYGLLPIFENTIVGLKSCPPSLLEAASGMGMSAWQRLRSVELPLAMPMILEGVRLSLVINVGTATIGSTVAAKGLGEVIIAGLLSNNTAFILQGGLVTGLMAILLYDAMATVERRYFRAFQID
jgi:ABC-type proline/glycine betaine transport system permease subunit